MNDLLLRLRDKGNTVLVVEHKPETIAIADHVVDLGPGAGTDGGEVVFEGDRRRACGRSGTLTGRHLDDRAALKAVGARAVGRARGPRRRRAQPAGRRRRHPARRARRRHRRRRLGQELADRTARCAGRDGVVAIDQAAIRGSRRSNPATYTGLLDPIRKAFAKANGVKPALFSANSEGACPTCNGAGVIYTDLAMMAGVATTCEECEGKRFERRRCSSTRSAARTSARCSRCRSTEAEAFFGEGEAEHARRAQDPRAPGRRRARLPHASASRSPRCPAASASGSSSPPTWASKGERLRPRRADHRPAPRRRRAAARPARPARRRGQVGDRHRAPPGRDGARRLDHRPRPGRRPRRRPGRLRGHARRPRRRALHPHRRAPRRLRALD